MPWLLLALLDLPLLACVWLLVRGSRAGGTLRALLRAVGWLALAPLPAIVAQLLGDGRGSHDADLVTLLFGLSMLWWVHLGGHSVRLLFEATVGPRQVTMLGDLDWFLLLVVVQTALLACLVAWRWRHGMRLLDPIAMLAFLAVAANAWANLSWTWWGT